MNLQNDSTKTDKFLQEHLNMWDHKILPHFPDNLDETAAHSGALQRKRGSTIRKAINNIYDMLADMPKEKRLAFFEQISKPKDLDFVMEIDGTYYVVCTHFDRGHTPKTD